MQCSYRQIGTVPVFHVRVIPSGSWIPNVKCNIVTSLPLYQGRDDSFCVRSERCGLSLLYLSL